VEARRDGHKPAHATPAAVLVARTTDLVVKCVETIAESSCIVVIREPSIKKLLLQIDIALIDEVDR
jgi:hypothetical protein